MPKNRDWAGRSAEEFIGLRTADPAGVVVGGYVDGCGVILFEVRCDDGTIVENVPLEGQPPGYPEKAED